MPVRKGGVTRESQSRQSARNKSFKKKMTAVLRRYVGFEWTKGSFHWMNRNVEMIDAEYHAQRLLAFAEQLDARLDADTGDQERRAAGTSDSGAVVSSPRVWYRSPSRALLCQAELPSGVGIVFVLGEPIADEVCNMVSPMRRRQSPVSFAASQKSHSPIDAAANLPPPVVPPPRRCCTSASAVGAPEAGTPDEQAALALRGRGGEERFNLKTEVLMLQGNLAEAREVNRLLADEVRSQQLLLAARQLSRDASDASVGDSSFVDWQDDAHLRLAVAPAPAAAAAAAAPPPPPPSAAVPPPQSAQPEAAPADSSGASAVSSPSRRPSMSPPAASDTAEVKVAHGGAGRGGADRDAVLRNLGKSAFAAGGSFHGLVHVVGLRV